MTREEKAKIVMLVSALATLLAVIMIIGLIINLVRIGNLSGRKKFLQNELTSLTERNQILSADIDYRNREEYIERYAREQLGMIKEDEEVYTAK